MTRAPHSNPLAKSGERHRGDLTAVSNRLTFLTSRSFPKITSLCQNRRLNSV